MKTLLAAATLFVSVPLADPAHPTWRNSRPGCPQTFTAPMIRRAIDAVYRGTRDVSSRERTDLSRYVRCARNVAVRPAMHRYWHEAWRAWWRRLHPPMFTQLASWYTDLSEGTACGFHAYYGVANKRLPCGTRVVMRYHGRRVTGVVQDRGPFVGGRVWDLGEHAAAALGFNGVDFIQVSVPG